MSHNAQILAEIENSKKTLLSAYELALTHGEKVDQHVFLNAMAELSTIQNYAKFHTEALETIKDDNSDYNELNAKYTEAYNQQVAKFHPEKYSEYKRLKAELNKIEREIPVEKKTCTEEEAATTSRNCADKNKNSNTSIEDDMIIESELCSVDPLTKKQIQDPVRNTICGHYYEKSTIMQIITANKHIKCPVAGCGNKKKITNKHLVADKALKVRLQQVAEEGSKI